MYRSTIQAEHPMFLGSCGILANTSMVNQIVKFQSLTLVDTCIMEMELTFRSARNKTLKDYVIVFFPL